MEYTTDGRLSWKAKGVMAYIAALQADEVCNISKLQTLSTDGRDSVASAFRELEQAGYIERRRVRDSKGCLRGAEYVVLNKREER